MFFIFGWNQPDIWNLGTIGLTQCPTCNKNTEWDVLQVSTSFTLFFIPVFKQERSFRLACSVCNSYMKISAASIPDYKNLVQIQSDFTNGKISQEERNRKAALTLKLAEQKAEQELKEAAQSFSPKIAAKSDQELLDIYHNRQDQYTEGFLVGVHSELVKRNLIKK